MDEYGRRDAFIGDELMRLQAVERTGTVAALLGHPALGALLADIMVTEGDAAGSFSVQVPQPGHVIAAPALAGRPGGLVLLRYALELAWLRRLAGLPQAAAVLLAARAAGRFLALLRRVDRDAALEDPAMPLFARLGDQQPTIAQMTSIWRQLIAGSSDRTLYQAFPDTDAPDLAALELVGRLWAFAAPAEALLVEGGDDRLTLDPATGLNRYFCSPWPRPDVIAFASCTASSISPSGFAAAEQARQALVAAATHAPPDEVLQAASARITEALLEHFGVADLAEAVLAASGTDATLLLTGLLAAERPRRAITTILMSPSETGSGVPEAVQGRHFASCTASGAVVEKGGSVDGFPAGLSFTSVKLRDTAGMPRETAAIAADCAVAISAATTDGHVVLHAIDGSKTGLAAPGLATCEALAARFGDRLDIVVDACQVRIEPSVVRSYLERGWPVLITGSKFFGAPGFCGAILFPKLRLRRVAGGGLLPGGLGAYASLSDGGMSRHCPGLLLRWTAALAEMSRFAQLPAAAVRAAIETMGGHVREQLLHAPKLRLVPAPRPTGAGWSDRRTVMTFAMRAEEGWLSADALRPIYRRLAEQGCLIGQPVQLGAPSLGGLRIAFSASQIAGGGQSKGVAAVFETLRHIMGDVKIGG